LGAGKVGEKEINKPFIAAAASSRFPIQRAIGLKKRDHQKPPSSPHTSPNKACES
jgi:hypothetical protein